MGFPKLLAWNCQGIASSHTTRALKQHIWRDCPDVVFLSKTKNDDPEVDSKKAAFGFSMVEYVSPIGRSRGLALW